MPRRDKRTERKVEELIIEYVEQNEGADSLNDIADYVQSQIGERPSLSTVRSILHEAGLELKPARWERV